MRIPDEQLALFEQRLQALGLGRRDFLKAVGAMAAFGGLGFATRAEAAKPFKLAPGEKLAKEQVLRLGGGGFWQNDPSSHDYNKDLYCAGVPSHTWPPRSRATRTVPSGPSPFARTAAGPTTRP